MKLLHYLLQVSACSGMFYLFYFLVLQRFTFFTLNRWYLILSLLISLVVPVVSIPVASSEKAALAPAARPTADTSEAFGQEQVVPVPQNETALAPMATLPAKTNINYENLLQLSYMTIAGVLLLHLLFSLLLLIYRLKGETTEKRGPINLIRNSRYFITGSFFNYVFITEKDLSPQEQELVLAHETVHVKKLHSIDKLLAGFVKVMLWFNPFAYAYAHAIDANHEFEVDSYLTANAAKKPYAELLLYLAVGETKLYHHFSELPLQKRITMLYHKPSGNMKKLTYLFALPLMAVALFAFAERKAETIYQTKPKDQETAGSAARALTENESVPRQQEQTVSQAPAPVISFEQKITPPTHTETQVLEREPKKGPIQTSVALTNYNEVKKIKPGQTTLEDIQKVYGKPTTTEVIEDITRWLYEIEQGRLFVAFDQENKVAGYSYSLRRPGVSSNLTAEKARQIKLKASTEADVFKLFGQPSDVSVSGRLADNATILHFRYPGSQPNQSLSVQLDNRSSDYVVSYCTYSSQKYDPIIIYPDKLTGIENGKTTITEIENKFGEPNVKKIYGQEEIWTYYSDISYLELKFKYKDDFDVVVLDKFRYERIP